ncbi:MAG: cytochrome c maturation protein CcmE [Kofleriaceae bacterium]
MDDAATNRTVAKLAFSGTLLVCMIVAGSAMHRPEPTYKMVDELTVTDRGRDLKVHGWVRAGSITHLGDAWAFTLWKSGKGVRVVLHEPFTDRIKDQSEVVVPGRLDDDGEVFVGTDAYSKCATKYEAPGKLGDKFM